jgi:serine/threonine protein kinase/Tfp pilus assembly protein PilF
VEEYAAALDGGSRPDRQAFLARHPALAAELAECLDGLEFVAAAASELGPPAEPAGPADVCGIAAEAPPFPLEGYRLVREIGRGGMGVVYEAVEVALGRRVALKLLPSAAALDFRQLQRFKHEARAAALLHHENIVPVFGVGCERGVHYYAMQYIDGVNLAAVVCRLRQRSGRIAGDCSGHGGALPAPSADTLPDAAAALSTQHGSDRPAFFRTVAQLGVQAAEALEHAHQVGVVHRDVKPANLLIDTRARLWITDFGLALCQGEGGLTRTGDLVGTLRYLSPEQALGRPGLVDHRTDVYGLGVTLYELLTLEPAYPGNDRQELLRQIAFEEPRPARRLNPTVPVELETILLKAMAKEPAGRYATAQEMADDLRRFLEDRPIRARRPTCFDRATKWARRHKPLVGAAVALVAVALVALAVSTALIWREQQKTKHEQLITKSALAEAHVQQREAREKQRLAQKVVDDTYTDVAQWLEEEPLSEPLQRDFFLRALKYYRDFASEKDADPEIKRQAARAGHRVGDIRQRLGEYNQAWEAYKEAIGRYEQLVADYPHVAEYRQDLAGCTNSLGAFLMATGRPREAVDKFRQAVGHFEQAAAASPGAPGSREGLATSLVNLALLLTETDGGDDQRREAEACCLRALALRGQLAAENPALVFGASAVGLMGSPPGQGPLLAAPALILGRTENQASVKNRLGLAQAHNGLGILYWEVGQLPRAEQHWRRALDLSRQLVKKFPRVPEYTETLATCSGHMGALLILTGRLQEAETHLRRVLVLGEQLTRDFPKKYGYLRDLDLGYSNLTILLHRTGRLKEAEQNGREAVKLGEELLKKSPGVAAHYRELAGSLHNLGNILKDTNRLGEAEALYTRAGDLMEKRANSPLDRDILSDSRNNLGSLNWTMGRVTEAERFYRDALVLRSRLVKDSPSVSTYRDKLAQSCNNLARLLKSTDRFGEAERLWRQALDLWARPGADSPRGELAEGHYRLGQLLWGVGRHREAHEEFQKSAEEWGRFLKPQPGHAAACNGLAWLLVTCPDPDLRDPSRAVELAEKAVSRAPGARECWNTLGVAHYRAGDYPAAQAALEKAVGLRPRGDGSDSLFLAMACWRLGQKEQADCWYDLAIEELEQDHISAAEHADFREEAAALLGRPDLQPN